MTALWSPLRARPPSGLEPFPNPRRSAPEALPSGPGWSNSPGTVSLELPTAETPSDRPRSRRNPGRAPEPPAPLRTARPGASPRRVPAHPRPTRLRAGSGAPPAPLHHRKLRPLPLPTPYWAAGRHLLLYSHSHWAGETPIERMLPPTPSPGRRLVKIWPSARLPPFTSSPIRSEGRQSLRLLPPTTEPPRPQGRARGLHLGRAPAPPPSFPSPLPPPSAVASRAAAASSQSRAPLAARCLRRAAAVRSGRAGGAGATFTSGLGLGAGGGDRGGAGRAAERGSRGPSERSLPGERGPRPRRRRDPRRGAGAASGRGGSGAVRGSGAARCPRAAAALGPSPPGAAWGECRLPGSRFSLPLRTLNFSTFAPIAELASPRVRYTPAPFPSLASFLPFPR